MNLFPLASLQASFQPRGLHFMVWGKPLSAITKAETKFFIKFFSLTSLQGSTSWCGENLCAPLLRRAETKFILLNFFLGLPPRKLPAQGVAFHGAGEPLHNMRPKLTQNSETKLLRSMCTKERNVGPKEGNSLKTEFNKSSR